MCVGNIFAWPIRKNNSPSIIEGDDFARVTINDKRNNTIWQRKNKQKIMNLRSKNL